MDRHRLWFRGPATTWVEALPLGDGHLGAMVFGDPGSDRFALNDDTLWSGSPTSELAGGAVTRDAAQAALSRADRALRDGDRVAADTAVRELQQRYTQAYLPLADLLLKTSSRAVDIVRELDLRAAVHTMTADLNGTRLRRRSYVSAADGTLVVETTTSEPTDQWLGLTTQLRRIGTTMTGNRLTMTLRCPADVAPTHEDVPEPIRYDEEPTASLQAAVVLHVHTDGRVQPGGDGISVRGATRLRILLATGTTFTGIGATPSPRLETASRRATATLDAALDHEPEELLARHHAEHARLYDRVDLQLGDARPGRSVDTTDRLATARAHPDHPLVADPGLAALLFHYGRYLLITSSRPGSLPANLQGIWNEKLQPPWSGNFTVNINTQMNYWGAEGTALPELVEPLFDLLEALAVRGAEVAERLYGRPGWVAHHNTDAWAYASPVGLGRGDPAWAFWPMAGPWLVRHLGEAVAHGASAEVAERAWPLVRGTAEFVLAWLAEDGGLLGTPLSTSPENRFLIRDAEARDIGTASVARSAAMDLELIRDVLHLLLRLADLRSVTGDQVVAEAAAALPRVPVPSIGADGGIQEWGSTEEARDPHHRHVSMLYGLFPGERNLTAAERAAASRSLDLRGDDASGWSLVWKTALRARLRQPERVRSLLALMFRDALVNRGPWAGGLYPNLFAAHPPFQIDGNLGFVGALVEALVQSHDGRITLLPAVPDVFAEGRARGLRVRPGVTLDLTWSGGMPVAVGLVSDLDRTVTLVWDGEARSIDLDAGSTCHLTAADFRSAR